jgi:phosphomevalonate kinase
VKARAPGKLVVSGAYAVLEGAPALVAAADRYVLADATREATFITPEVREAFDRLGRQDYPWFDASSLRSDDRKLGLGSSAAILVASLGVVWDAAEPAIAEAVFPLALESHRVAQGGGSGVDVAAACFGGVLRCRLDGELSVEPHVVVEGLVFETWACPGDASTSAMLAEVRRLREGDEATYRRLLSAASQGATQAVDARDPAAFIAALGAQYDALGALGRAAGIPIVTPQMATLDEVAKHEAARFGPSGAGGGDIALYVGQAASTERFRARAEAEELCLLDLQLGAPGLQRLP